MGLIHLLSSRNYIVVNKLLIQHLGVSEAIILGELCAEYDYWSTQDKLKDDDMFFCSISKLEENTGLNEYEQRKAIKSLERQGILEIKLKGLPATRYFHINEDNLNNFLSSSSLNFKELVPKNLKTSNNITNNNSKTVLPKGNTVAEAGIEFNFGAKKPATKTSKPSLWDRCVSEIHNYTDDKELIDLLVKALKLFLENSKEAGTPLYFNNFKGKLNKLDSIADVMSDVKAVVRQTLDNGWNNFYPLNNKSTGKGKTVATDIGIMSEPAQKKGGEGVGKVY